MLYSKDILNEYSINKHKLGSFKQFISKHKEWLDDILKFQQKFHFEDFTFQQLVYHYCYDITEHVLCEAGNPKNFNSFSKGYATMCVHKHKCPNCSNKADKKLKETCLEKYGVDSFSQTDNFKNEVVKYLHTEETNIKRKKTCLEKYGSEYQIASIETRNKAKQTILSKYGVNNVFESTEIKNKIKQTIVKRYGTECVLLNDNIKNKCKQTMLERYGVEYAMQSKEILNKTKENNLEKYGKEYYVQTNEFKEKSKETIIEKYGKESYTQTEEYKFKTKNTCLEKYGTLHSSQNEAVKNKQKQTNILKYGKEYYFQTDDYKEKTKKTCLEKYGVENPMNSDIIKERIKLKYGEEYVSQSDEVFNKIISKRYKSKAYTFSSGKVVKVQGYENLALDFLLKTIPEDNILVSTKEYTDKIGKIYYYKDGKRHRYFPDIVVKNNDTYIIYEIKSTYTYKVGMEDASIIYKMKACNEAGYDAVVMVFNGDGTFLFENKYNKQDNE